MHSAIASICINISFACRMFCGGCVLVLRKAYVLARDMFIVSCSTVEVVEQGRLSVCDWQPLVCCLRQK
jgi:hypothetical protein